MSQNTQEISNSIEREKRHEKELLGAISDLTRGIEQLKTVNNTYQQAKNNIAHFERQYKKLVKEITKVNRMLDNSSSILSAVDSELLKGTSNIQKLHVQLKQLNATASKLIETYEAQCEIDTHLMARIVALMPKADQETVRVAKIEDEDIDELEALLDEDEDDEIESDKKADKQKCLVPNPNESIGLINQIHNKFKTIYEKFPQYKSSISAFEVKMIHDMKNIEKSGTDRARVNLTKLKGEWSTNFDKLLESIPERRTLKELFRDLIDGLFGRSSNKAPQFQQAKQALAEVKKDLEGAENESDHEANHEKTVFK